MTLFGLTLGDWSIALSIIGGVIFFIINESKKIAIYEKEIKNQKEVTDSIMESVKDFSHIQDNLAITQDNLNETMKELKETLSKNSEQLNRHEVRIQILEELKKQDKNN